METLVLSYQQPKYVKYEFNNIFRILQKLDLFLEYTIIQYIRENTKKCVCIVEHNITKKKIYFKGKIK